ncbi:hypothetical protein HNY73_014048 [Argiope bruennichi]|uniref:Uncharacterized protein n=1 Tax=Argiope bruennichi TaxID=94029 RepID=A0A8T0EN16_ARGBR|nr:hypothetical protein HNY73_014048 [Argiope bruennichi]
MVCLLPCSRSQDDRRTPGDDNDGDNGNTITTPVDNYALFLRLQAEGYPPVRPGYPTPCPAGWPRCNHQVVPPCPPHLFPKP